MKKFLISKCMNYIKNNTNYDSIKLEEIKYGLTTIYLTTTKIIIIFMVSLILGIFKEMLTYLLIYNILRTSSFGLHATKSWICLLSSTILFVGIPHLCIILTIPLFLKVVIGAVGIYLMFKNAPADTKKRPIVSKKRRLIYKYISSILTIIFAFNSILITNNFMSNCLIFSIIMQNIMISPSTYKLFKLPYNNYITYLKNHPEYTN